MKNDTFSDEILSAFLDAELPEQQMEQIRAALLDDDNLAERLANLAMVDEIVANEYDKINQQPLPAAINELLAAIPEDSASTESLEKAKEFTSSAASQKQLDAESKVVSLSLWQRTKNAANNHYSIAASVAVAAGLFATLFFQQNTVTGDTWQEVAQILDNQTSGIKQTLADGSALSTKLTFTNQQGDFCRQYDVDTAEAVERNIACRVNQEWELASTVYEAKKATQATQNYQTATTNSMLREQINSMADGDFLDKQQEQQMINNGWNK